jgi:alpha-glucuronidase
LIIATLSGPSAHAATRRLPASNALNGTVEDAMAIVQKAKDYLPQIRRIVDKAGDYLPTIALIAEDPALPVLAKRIRTLNEIEKKYQAKQRQAAGITAPSAGQPQAVGIGLRKAVKPLDFAIWAAQNRGKAMAVLIAVPVTLLLGAFFLGRLSVRKN